MTKNSETKKTTFNKVKYQFISVICANLIGLSHGCVVGWLSPFLPFLQSNDSPLLTGPITTEDTSWIGGLMPLGGICGAYLYGTISNYFGRKNTIVLLVLPQIIFWCVIILAKHVYLLYVARYIVGFTGGGYFVLIPLYVAEIADDDVRGTLGALLLLICNSGILIAYIIGMYVSYATFPIVMLIFPIIFFILMLFLPETPQYFLQRNKIKEAKNSIIFYKNIDMNSVSGEKELKVIYDQSQINCTTNKNNNNIQLKDFCTPNARKGLLIGCTLMMLNVFCGCFILINYAATIFKASGSDISPHLSAVSVGLLQVMGTYASTHLVDKIGRRILLIISSSGATIFLLIMGGYSYFEKHNYNVYDVNWIPVLSLSLLIFIASVGIIPLPFVILAEVLPSKIRGIGSTICTSTFSIFAFTMLTLFPILMETIELYGCMWLLASVTLSGLIFIITIVPETKGKNLNIV